MDSLIISDNDSNELGYLPKNIESDIEIGTDADSNTFQLTVPADDFDKDIYKFNNQIYIPNTEFGGIIDKIKSMPSSNKIVISGITFRGLLSKKILQPPKNQDYYVLNNYKLSSFLDYLINNNFDNFKNEYDGDILITEQFRYDTFLDILNSICENNNLKLVIKYNNYQKNEQKSIISINLIPVDDYSNEIVIDNNSNVKFNAEKNIGGINHLICLGKGELKDRTVLHLFVNQKNQITTSQYYFNNDERTTTYDYSSAANLTELKKYGIEKLKELMNYSKCDSLTINNMNLNIGDIVGGTEFVTGISTKNAVNKIIYKSVGNNHSIEYQTKG